MVQPPQNGALFDNACDLLSAGSARMFRLPTLVTCPPLQCKPMMDCQSCRHGQVGPCRIFSHATPLLGGTGLTNTAIMTSGAMQYLTVLLAVSLVVSWCWA